MRSSNPPNRLPRAVLRSLLCVLVLAPGCGRDADDHVRYARLHDERGDHVAAAGEWSEAIESAPRRADLYVGRGRSYLASRQFAKARDDLMKAVALSPTYTEARFLIVDAWLEEGMHDRAIAAAEGLDAVDAARAERTRGRILLARAVAGLREMLASLSEMAPIGHNEIWRDVVSLRFDHARTLMTAPDQIDEVRTLMGALDGAENSLADATEHLTRAAQGEGTQAHEAVCDLVEIDLLALRPEAGAARLRELIQRNPVGATRLRVLRMQAECAEHVNDIQAALGFLSTAIDEHPENLDLRFARAMLFLKQSRAHEAEPDVAMVSQDPYRRTQTAMLRGITKVASGDPGGAVADFQYVVATAGSSPLSQLWLGIALTAAGADHASAMASFTRAVELDPRYYMGHLARATTALTAGWDSEAIEHAERCTQLEPRRAAGWLVLGEAYVRIGTAQERPREREATFARAAEALGQALQLDPGGFTGQEALLMRNVVTGRLAEGIEVLRKALAASGKPDLMVSLGELLLADRRDEEGLQFLREAVAAAPTSFRAIAALSAALHDRDDVPAALAVLESARSAGAGGDVALLLAQYQVNLGRKDDAQKTVESAARGFPRHAGLAALRLQLALTRGDLAGAESACDAGLVVDQSTRAFHAAGGLKALRGDLGGAADVLARSVIRFPSDPTLRAVRAIVAARMGDTETALSEARQAVERGGPDLYIVAAASLAMLTAGDTAGARAVVEGAAAVGEVGRRVVNEHVQHAVSSKTVRDTLVDLHLRVLAVGLGAPGVAPSEHERRAAGLAEDGTDDLLLLDLLGNAHLARGDTNGAARLYERIIAKQPRLTAAREKLALIHIAAGKPDVALSSLQALFRRGEAGPSAHALAGALYDEQDDVDSARRHLEMAARMAGENPDIVARLAHVLERAGDAAGARQRWEQVLRLAPMHAPANARLAELLASQDPVRSEMLARRAVAVAPGAPFARRALAFALAHLDRTDEALAELDKAARIDDADASTWTLRGTLLFSADRRAEAKDAFERAIQADDSSSVAHLYVGLLAESDGDLERAKRAYERVLELEPKHPIALNNLAAVLLRADGDLRRALDLARSAVQISGGRGDMLDTQGWIEHRLGEHDAACATLQRAIGASPRAPSIRYHLAEALAAAGRRLDALRELDVLAKAGDFPESADADTLRRRLSR